MPFNLSPLELVAILVVVLLVFGVGRISKISKELGSSVREFRKGLKGDEEEEVNKAQEEVEAPK